MYIIYFLSTRPTLIATKL